MYCNAAPGGLGVHWMDSRAAMLPEAAVWGWRVWVPASARGGVVATVLRARKHAGLALQAPMVYAAWPRAASCIIGLDITAMSDFSPSSGGALWCFAVL